MHLCVSWINNEIQALGALSAMKSLDVDWSVALSRLVREDGEDCWHLWERTGPLRAGGATAYGGSRSPGHILSGSEGLDHVKGPSPSCEVAVESYLDDMGKASRRLPGRCPDGGQESMVTRWMRLRAATAYTPITTYAFDIQWQKEPFIR